jgi:FtsZ-interacting cell division protein ZipA
MWEDANYYWVVLCKNFWFHMRQNVFFRHKIPLGETDAVTPLPPLGKRFTVRCDECRKTYTYKPEDVRRIELELPKSFKPHPLFQEELALDDSNRSTEQEPRQEVRPQEEPPRPDAPQEERPETEPTQEERLQRQAGQEEPRQEEPSQKEVPKEEAQKGEPPQKEPSQEGLRRAKGA